MKRTLFVIISLIFFHKSNSQIMWEFKKDTVIGWYFSEGDEFNNDTINLNYWKYIGSSRSLFANKEQEYYTDGKNHFVNNGSLKLTAKKESVFQRTIDWMNDNDSLVSGKKFYGLNKRQFNYTAGKLISQKRFNKGFFECRFKVPPQKGYWPAFWLYGGSPNEEIDMMECKSENPQQVHLDTHCGNHCDFVSPRFLRKSYGGWIKTDCNFIEGFNVVGCHWDEHEVRYYLNGECIGVSKVTFDVEKNLAINIAVPSDRGPFGPGPTESDTTTAIYEIDYVRVWKKDKALKQVTIKPSYSNAAIDNVKPLRNSSLIKSRNKIAYGKKRDHKDDGVFISCFQNKDLIQLYVLGVFRGVKPIYTIRSLSGEVHRRGEIKSQLFCIETQDLPKGDYEIIIECEGKQVKNKFTL